MDCKEFENAISDFMGDRLDNQHLSQFLEHMKSCRTCKEEFSIQLVVHRGVERLETGETFNLNDEIKLEIGNAQRSLTRRTKFVMSTYAAEAAAIIVTALLAGAVVFFWC